MRRHIFANQISALNLRFIVSGGLSLMLIMAQAVFDVTPLSHLVSRVALPIQDLSQIPSDLFHNFEHFFSTKRTAIKTVNQLRMDKLRLQVKLQHLKGVEQENKMLKRLLNGRPSQNPNYHLARSMHAPVYLSPRFWIDLGQADHVRPHMAVVNGLGMVGQVQQVYPHDSEVLSITHPKSAIPVMSVRNQLDAIALGTGHHLKLIHVPITTNVKEGDEFVTSGLGGVLPPNIPVGRVKRVERMTDQKFMEVELQPLGLLTHTRYVVVIGQKQKEDRNGT